MARARTHRARRERSTRSPLPKLILVLVALVLVGVGGCQAWQRLFPPEEVGDVTPGQVVTVTIPDGSGTQDIANILFEGGIIAKRSDFTGEVKRQDAGASMKSGTYDIVTGANVADIVRLLVSGPNSNAKKLTVPEGLTVSQTATAVQTALGISTDDFLAQAKASNYVDDYPFLSSAQNDSLEGFLYPKTYDLSATDGSADAVIRAMLDQYRSEVMSLDLASAETGIESAYGITMSDYDIINMASIIEKEAHSDDDRPKMASVMCNRMKAGMRLQSDVTIMYVTGREPTKDDLASQSPYNTYVSQGLPPTPICSPSMASIKAAMAPASTNYLYWYWNGSETVFSETFEQHQQAQGS
ncbi:endolytic transglycosylase MltG [Olsenella profusa]|uniref:endolytic transglycosylase MltG n=1 Tax=Olsenella profusa TaxID=138595 RepID=UPI0027D92B64|nr:endolytic transglycosylase MltG [Olsenella profusa]